MPKKAKQIISVGGPGADIAAYTSLAIQIAVDALKTRGGGVVQLGRGTYEVIGPIRLASRVSLIGHGKSTILHKVDGYKSPFVVDADYGQLKLTVKDVSGFRVGMGVQIYDAENYRWWNVTTAKITAIEGNVIYIDNYLVEDYFAGKQGMVSNACSIVEAVGVEDIHIANFVIDGNRATNELINGCRGGGIYLHKTRRVLIEGVEVKNFAGDGIDGQITEDVTVRNCEVHDCARLGFHPGTGSARTIIEGCKSYLNESDGIFLCWSVQNAVFRNNTIYKNHGYGISIGHKDTDNVFVNNHIYENGLHGIILRKETEQNSGHRNSFYGNVIENNGTKKAGYGFYIDGVTRDIVIENNTIRDTGKGSQKGGVYIGENTSSIKVVKNQMSGHSEGDVIDKSAGRK